MEGGLKSGQLCPVRSQTPGRGAWVELEARALDWDSDTDI